MGFTGRYLGRMGRGAGFTDRCPGRMGRGAGFTDRCPGRMGKDAGFTDLIRSASVLGSKFSGLAEWEYCEARRV